MSYNSAARKITRKRLRALTKNGRTKRLRNTRRVLKYGTINFGRNIWLSTAATLVMIVTLVVLSITLLATLVLSETADAIRDKIDITIFFKPETPASMLNSLKDKMASLDNVKSVVVRTSEEEYDNVLAEYSDDERILATLEDPDMDMRSMIISTMQATMRLKVYDPENLQPIKNLVASDLDFIKNIDPDKEPTYDVNNAEIATITRWAHIARTAGIILSAVFLTISMLVIFNTIRMAIFSRREEIYMMKLVGADRHFIRGPFLVEAQLCGIVSGLCAFGLSYAGYRFIEPHLNNYGISISRIAQIMDSNQIIYVAFAMVGCGILIGTISAHLAIHKYIKNATK